MTKDNFAVFFIFGYILAIFLTIWGIFWGLPLLANFINNPWYKFLSVFFILPVFPMLPALFTGSYKARTIPKIYLYEFFDMYMAVFFIIIYLPALFVQVFAIMGAVVLVACGVIIFIWGFKFGFNLHFANGLAYNDFLFYAAILQSGLLLMLGAKYLNHFLEKAADSIEEETTSKLSLLMKYFQKKRKSTKDLYQKKS